jgi:hypothetical protein
VNDRQVILCNYQYICVLLIFVILYQYIVIMSCLESMTALGKVLIIDNISKVIKNFTLLNFVMFLTQIQKKISLPPCLKNIGHQCKGPLCLIKAIIYVKKNLIFGRFLTVKKACICHIDKLSKL